VCAYQIMIMCSWSCNIILYGTVFDLGGKSLIMDEIRAKLTASQGQWLLSMARMQLCRKDKKTDIDSSQTYRRSLPDNLNVFRSRVRLDLANGRWSTILHTSSCKREDSPILILRCRMGRTLRRNIHGVILRPEFCEYYPKLRRGHSPGLCLAVMDDMACVLAVPYRSISPKLFPQVSSFGECTGRCMDDWRRYRVGCQFSRSCSEAERRFCV
jgi:hypothetical protein